MAEVEGSSPSVPIENSFENNIRDIIIKKEGTTTVSQVSILEQIKFLVNLQAIDFEVYQIQKELKEKPLLIEQLRNNFESKKSGLKSLEDKLKSMLVDRKSKEVELQAKEEQIIKANGQLSQLKTNKEYQAKLSEIESIKADKSLIEEKILIAFDEADAVNKDIQQEKDSLAEQEKKYLAQSKEVEGKIREFEDRLKVLEGKRNQVLASVDKDFLVRYERILKNKDGLAIVPIKGNACGGCYMNVPPQVINELKMHDHLIYCEMCARILYLEEDVSI